MAVEVEFGIIVTNRNRPQPLRNCLLSLATQKYAPRWVVISDFGSTAEYSGRLQQLAEEYGISYLLVGDRGPWRQSLAFNTALRNMPEASHVVQLDSDMILHPYMLEFTRRFLQKAGAVGCVTSYTPPGAAYDAYDGTCSSFQELLCRSKTGAASAIGGYMVLPRAWLIENRGFDEQFIGWGFEDAELWLRAQRDLKTYVEPTGSLLIHQAHERQPRASMFRENPNWDAYNRRKRGDRRRVNPVSFGDAPVEKQTLRFGTRRTALAGNRADYPWVRQVPLRRFRDGRLRPHFGAMDPPDRQLRSRLESILQSDRQYAPVSISVLLLVQNHTRDAVVHALAGVRRQSVPAGEIILADCGSAEASSRVYCTLAQELGGVRYMRCSGKQGAGSRATTINAGLRTAIPTSSYVLITECDLVLHPRFLEMCSASAVNGKFVLHGVPHQAPPFVLVYEGCSDLPWEVLESLAFVQENDRGFWHFGPREWFLKAGLYDERLPESKVVAEAVTRAHRDDTIVALEFCREWPVSIRATCGREDESNQPLSASSIIAG